MQVASRGLWILAESSSELTGAGAGCHWHHDHASEPLPLDGHGPLNDRAGRCQYPGLARAWPACGQCPGQSRSGP
jgi:hypothetical protein